ncbi:MAG: SpoIVB peptidase S55 domain-containing protein [Polyangiaceae bacterium]
MRTRTLKALLHPGLPSWLPAASAGVGIFLALGLSAPLAHSQGAPATIGVEEIKEGMKGYGLTVFKGTEPERFDVEVIGVLKNFRPSQDLILVKTPHPRLNITKNVRGMSGSPIYLNGRLAGAYAYSWAMFQTEPVAGVTPIAPMLAELRRPIPPGFWPIEGGGPLPGSPAKAAPKKPKHAQNSTEWRGDPGTYDLEEHKKQLATRFDQTPAGGKPLVPVATPMMMGGVGERTQAYVRSLFEPLGMEPLAAGGGGGATVPGAPEHFVNGGSLGVSMVSGDVSFFGLGTVTHVEGRKLTGFGHPMMEAGVTALPTAISRVHWIFASDQHSSKIGESIRLLGALVQDRQSSVIADESVTAPTFPMSVVVKGTEGAPRTTWNMTVAQEKFMTPGLVAAALSGALEATANERRDVTWKLSSRITLSRYGTIDLEDIGVAVGGMPEAGEWSRSRLVRLIGEVLSNPWEDVRIERVESTLHVQYSREVAQLRGIDVLDPVVESGEKVRLRVRLIPFAGAAISKVIEVPIPHELAGRDVEIDVMPGFEVAPEVPAPENLAQLIANATKITPPRTLVAQVKLPSQGVTFQSHVAPRLPPFAADALRTHNADTTPEPFTSFARHFYSVDRYVEGRDKVRVKVKPR